MNCKSTKSRCWRAKSLWPFASCLLLASISWQSGAQSVDGGLEGWRITPRLSVGATYSDNIRLAPADEAEGDWVWQVDPGVSIRKRGGRLDLRLDYTAQGLMYTNNGDANTINNNLQAFGTAELYQDHFFVDAYGSISQVPVISRGRVDAGGLGASGGSGFVQSLFESLNLGLPGAQDLFYPIGLFSDLALTGNQTTSNNFGVSPYWRQNFGGWAEALLRYRYDEVRYSGRQESGDVPDVAVDAVELADADSQTNTIEFNLTSGRQFSLLTWNLDYFYQRQDDQQDDSDQAVGNVLGGGNTRQENVSGQLNYRLNEAWKLVAVGGYENNTGFVDNRNGSYWALGATWTPSRFYSLTGLYGSEYNQIAAQWNPSPRTGLQLSRTYQGVGTSPGVYWNGSLKHRTRHSTWSASYTQEVTTSQQLDSDSLVGVGADGQPNALADNCQGIGSGGPFGLTNQPFLRKCFYTSVSYQRGLYGLLFNAFTDTREFQVANLNNEDTYGAGVLWTWRFAQRTASFLGTGWEHDDLGEDQLGIDQQNDYWVSVIGLAHVFTPDSGGLISYRYYKNDADPSELSFRENRLNLRFSLKF